jgi:hypothetical protein
MNDWNFGASFFMVALFLLLGGIVAGVRFSEKRVALRFERLIHASWREAKDTDFNIDDYTIQCFLPHSLTQNQ